MAAQAQRRLRWTHWCVCLCVCGGGTKNRIQPGHDGLLKGRLLRAFRGPKGLGARQQKLVHEGQKLAKMATDRLLPKRKPRVKAVHEARVKRKLT